MMRDGKSDADLDLFFTQNNAAWDRAALLAAKIHNSNATKESEVKTPDQLNLTLNSGDCEDDPAIRAEEDRLIAQRRAEAARGD